MSHARTFIYESSDVPPSMTLREYRREQAPTRRRPKSRRVSRFVRVVGARSRVRR